MRLRQTKGKLLFGLVLLLTLARPVFACLSIAPVTPATVHDCCRHSCHHQQMQDGMEQCCRQQHDSITQPPVLCVGKTALDAGVVLIHALPITPSAVAEPTFVNSRYALGHIHAPPPLYLLHATLRI